MYLKSRFPGWTTVRWENLIKYNGMLICKQLQRSRKRFKRKAEELNFTLPKAPGNQSIYNYNVSLFKYLISSRLARVHLHG